MNKPLLGVRGGKRNKFYGWLAIAMSSPTVISLAVHLSRFNLILTHAPNKQNGNPPTFQLKEFLKLTPFANHSQIKQSSIRRVEGGRMVNARALLCPQESRTVCCTCIACQVRLKREHVISNRCTSSPIGAKSTPSVTAELRFFNICTARFLGSASHS
jgi:hypothetical protein